MGHSPPEILCEAEKRPGKAGSVGPSEGKVGFCTWKVNVRRARADTSGGLFRGGQVAVI